MDHDELISRLEQGVRRYVCEGREQKAEGIRWAIATITEVDGSERPADAMATGMRTAAAGVGAR